MATLPDTPYLYDAEVDHVIDGDSVWLKLSKTFLLDFGFKIIDAQTKETVQNFRLEGINAAELRGHTREAGLKAKSELEDLLENCVGLKAATHKTGKYGRYLVTLYLPDDSQEGGYVNLNEVMLQSDYVVAYGQPVPAAWSFE